MTPQAVVEIRIPWILGIVGRVFIAWFVGFLATNVVILGTGVLPVSLPMLGLMLLPISILCGVAAKFIPPGRRTTRLAHLALGVILLTGVFWQYRLLLDGALAHAKSFGAEVAASAQMYHDRTGRWPESLTELPPEIQPRYPTRISPYLTAEKPELPGRAWWIAGLGVRYELNDSQPILSIFRRQTMTTWDWKTKTWQ